MLDRLNEKQMLNYIIEIIESQTFYIYQISWSFGNYI